MPRAFAGQVTQGNFKRGFEVLDNLRVPHKAKARDDCNAGAAFAGKAGVVAIGGKGEGGSGIRRITELSKDRLFAVAFGFRGQDGVVALKPDTVGLGDDIA